VVCAILTAASGTYAAAWLIGDSFIRGQQIVSWQFVAAVLIAGGFGSATRWCFEAATDR
jgi:hypothetical protein